ncbi:MAG TPA: hypothetical protein VF221_07790 [Chloroflexota bacterium]
MSTILVPAQLEERVRAEPGSSIQLSSASVFMYGALDGRQDPGALLLEPVAELRHSLQARMKRVPQAWSVEEEIVKPPFVVGRARVYPIHPPLGPAANSSPRLSRIACHKAMVPRVRGNMRPDLLPATLRPCESRVMSFLHLSGDQVERNGLFQHI